MKKQLNVFTLSPEQPFLDTLASELLNRAKGDALKLSEIHVYLPTRRACRQLGMAFARLAAGKALLLPRMRALGDIDEDELTFADAESADLPPALPALKRLMLLARQVKARDKHLSWDQSLLSAQALAVFLDNAQIAGSDLERLPSLVEERELAEHWQQVIAFLDILTRHWPSIVKAEGCLDPADRRNKAMAAQTAAWRKSPPASPIIAAGSTGTIPATREMLKAIAEMPNGAVILPGLDRDIDNAAWDAIDETHPQHSMKQLLESMGVDRKDVKPLSAGNKKTARTRLLSETFRPAGTTEEWRKLRGKLKESATHGLTRLVLDTPQEEAQVIALRLREALEHGDKKAALVTADRALARRVAALLSRWGIDVDDSGGRPALATPTGSFLDLVLSAADPNAGHVDYLALLKHPLAACGHDAFACRAAARQAEIKIRRHKEDSFLALKERLAPLARTWNEEAPLRERIIAHIAAAQAVAETQSEKNGSLWKGEEGRAIAEWLDDWGAAADAFPSITGADYALMFAAMAAAKTLRSGRKTHPRLAILGLLEARLLDADLIVLSGLNEGVWPPDVGFDPWLSRPMRAKLGLPSPEYRIGRSAHDFVQLASAKEVLLTRALRARGQPTVPSRFLLQLEAVLEAAGLSDKANNKDALAEPRFWKDWARALDKPQGKSEPCAPPEPRPPLAARPKCLPVTHIATWIQNPYALYARHILRLEKLEELDAPLDAADRGSMIHKALERFTQTYSKTLPDDAKERLVSIAHDIFAQEESNPRIRAFWETRFAESADWFVEKEQKRRAGGEFPAGIEAKGKCVIDGFTLEGRADRINRKADGSLVVIDYKTGKTPAAKAVTTCAEPQLPLLAMIAARGGFASLSPAAIASFEYWKLGSRSQCGLVEIKDDVPAIIDKATSMLKDLIAAYRDPSMPYLSVPRPWLQPDRDDYEHLSRRAEWGRQKTDDR